MTEYGSRAERWVATRWPAIRARGMWRFVLLKGVVFWGGLMLAFMALLMTFQLGPSHPRLPLVLAVAVPLCAFGGLCWGLLTWIFNERIYHAIKRQDFVHVVLDQQYLPRAPTEKEKIP